VRNNILFITLSNIGDAILTLPVLDILKDRYPDSKITVVCSERSKAVFIDNPLFGKVIVYKKSSGLKEKLKLVKSLREEYFDFIIDLRNSAFPFFLRGRKKTTPFDHILKKNTHIKDWHIAKLRNIIKNVNFNCKRQSFHIKEDSHSFINNKLSHFGLKEGSFVIIAAGARSFLKRWDKDKYLDLGYRIINELNLDIVLIGDNNDKAVCDYLQNNLKSRIFNLVGQTNFNQIAALFSKGKLVIANDSGILHLASYLDIPVLGLYGPSDEKKYGPWSRVCVVVRKKLDCAPCEKAHCKFKEVKCLTQLDTDFVFSKLQNLINEL